jgi:L-alanine-DL-glutamate epimerase-like enolase superfamily enzyme
MKITAVRLYVLENAAGGGRANMITRVPELQRIQYTHKGVREGPARQHFLEVETDAGISGRCTTTMRPEQAAIIRRHAIGGDPLEREHWWQLFHKGTRWVYQEPGWFGDFDSCLWDIAGKAAGLPVYALVGRVRQALPVYLTGGDMSLQGYLDSVERGLAFGVKAYKTHSYKGGKADVPIFRELRKAVGPDYALINDPVCSYTLRESIELGHLMEELDFVWLEEPMFEQRMNLYQELCRELTLPVMATERLMHDIELSAQWLIQGATDRLRANARHGTTQVLKLAHFAELYGTNVELNGEGGLFGLLHAHLGCCIDNTDYYEYNRGTADGLRSGGEMWGMVNAPLIVDGTIAPPDGPGWGAEWDEDRFHSLVVATHAE